MLNTEKRLKFYMTMIVKQRDFNFEDRVFKFGKNMTHPFNIKYFIAQKNVIFAYMKDTVGLTLSVLQPVSTSNPIYRSLLTKW